MRLTTTSTTAAFLLSAVIAFPAFGGPVSPPAGAVGSTGKTLTEVEPRIAINATNTPGDADATPSTFKITQPGSYYLTGNITGESGKDGIEIASAGVTLDLNGFAVIGVPGSLSGVVIRSGATEVRNGFVRSWGVDGVTSGSAITNNRVIDVRASGNGGVGIYAGNYSEARNCMAVSNGSHGIAIYAYGRAEGCTARSNGGDGISAPNSGNVIINCNSNLNGGNGFNAFSSTLTACNASGNTLSGIAATYSSVIDCNSSSNTEYGFTLGVSSTARGNRSFGNESGGFYAVTSCTLENNTANNNGNNIATRTGFTFNGAANRATNNHAANNPVGFYSPNGPNVLTGNTAINNTVSGYSVSTNANTLLTGNIAVGSPTNFIINAGNDSGAVITNPGVGFTTTNPAANIAN